MKVLMLSWEYPPKNVGGLAQHVYDLTIALARNGIDVHLLTCGDQAAPADELVNGVHVHRVEPYRISAPDFVTWVAQFNVAMLERAISMVEEVGGIRILHAHDWLVAYAARALKHALRIPLVVTIHATEYGRNNGLHNQTQRHISDIEWWLTFEAWRVICCSRYMEGEVRHVFQLPTDKIKVVPNGVDPHNFTVGSKKVAREHYAAPDEKIVFFVGRLVREKGVQVLLDAAPLILAHYPKTKFIIAGKGPFENVLRRQANQSGIANRVYFTGYIDEEVRNSLYSWADVAVFPSIYEPFGIVALEAMAAGVPVVAADSGGLGEIVRHGVNGLKAYPDNSHSLAQNVLAILHQPQLGRQLKNQAYREVQDCFNWREIARQTGVLYKEVLEEYRSASWQVPEQQGRIFNRVYRLLGKSG